MSKVRWRQGTIYVAGWQRGHRRGEQGWVAHPPQGNPLIGVWSPARGIWSITHLHSGLRVRFAGSLRDARRDAVALLPQAPATFWTETDRDAIYNNWGPTLRALVGDP